MLQRDDTLCARSRAVLGVLLFARWLIWDVAVRGLGWVVGWPLWRALSLGRFPSCSISDQTAVSAVTTVVVHVTGVLTVSACAWLLWAGNR